MTEMHNMPSIYDSQFWRLRSRLLKRAGAASLVDLALAEARKSLDQAARWTQQGQEPSAEGERRRSRRLELIADLETRDPPYRASILRLRAAELRTHGQSEAASALSADADAIMHDYLVALGPEALKADRAANVLHFARASLDENPRGPHAPRLRKLIASARRTIAGSSDSSRTPSAA